MSVDDVISALEESKRKLLAAKNTGLKGASAVAKARDSVLGALGRAGSGSALLAELSAKEKAIVAQVMGIDELVRRVDAAIHQARNAGTGPATAGTRPGTASTTNA